MKISYKDVSRYSGVSGEITTVGSEVIVVRSEKSGKDVEVRFDNIKEYTIVSQPTDAVAQDTPDLDALEVRLARVTSDWTIPSVVRSFGADEEGQEDFEDERVIFEIHGYASDTPEGPVSKVTFFRGQRRDRED